MFRCDTVHVHFKKTRQFFDLCTVYPDGSTNGTSTTATGNWENQSQAEA